MSDDIKDGGPAFPLATTSETIDYHGMSLRDWFAGQALAGLCAHTETGGHTPKRQAELAYECADAMLARRAQA